jgi:hypothetical protein
MWCWGNEKCKMENAKLRVSGLFAFLIVPCILLLSGCSLLAKPKMPVLESPLQEATLERLMGLLQEREAEIHTLKGLFGAQIQGPGIPGTQRVEGSVVYHRPDALRLRGFNRLGMRLFELAVGEDRYTLRLINGKVLTGNMTDLNRVEKVARPFRLSLLAMTGITGTPPVANDERAALTEEVERYRVDVFARGNRMNGLDSPYRRIWFDRRSLHVVQEDRLSPSGDIEATVHFDDFRSVNLSPDGAMVEADTSPVKSVLRPFVIRAEESQGPSSLQLIFREMAPNMPLTAEELHMTDAKQTTGRTVTQIMV